ncbi:Riboflavin synthase alpha chain [Blastocladiella emersonii ATCC 22665]|nr:Riboflavin synthase alpha chain [Blastocladiella emersonii ATCC 22665]
MFTGIVETIGKVLEIVEHDTTSAGGDAAGGWTMTIGECASILADCHEGDSIAVNGTCLTVTDFTTDTFKMGLMAETLRRTNLGQLTVGSPVNLERAMAGHTRFGGHFVQGHVDGTAAISKRTNDGNSIIFEFTLPTAELMPYIIPKGYVTLDGTSLTVCDVYDDRNAFTICMVAYTQTHVVMPTKAIGDTVNVEVDMLGKYVERVIAGIMTPAAASSDSAVATPGARPTMAAMLEQYVEKAVDRALAKRQ